MNTTTVDPATELFFEVAVKLGLMNEAAEQRCLAMARRSGKGPDQIAIDRGLLTPAQVARVNRVAAARAARTERRPANADEAWTGLIVGTLAAFAAAACMLFVAVLVSIDGASSLRPEGADASCLTAFLITFLLGEGALLVVAQRLGWRLSRPDLPGWVIVGIGACVSAAATYFGMLVVVFTMCIPRIGQMCASSGSANDPMVTTLMYAVTGCLFGALFLPACFVAALPRATSAAPCAPGAAPAVRLCAPPGVKRPTRRDP